MAKGTSANGTSTTLSNTLAATIRLPPERPPNKYSQPMTITVRPSTRMSEASFPTKAASLKMVCTIPGQKRTNAPPPKCRLNRSLPYILM